MRRVLAVALLAVGVLLVAALPAGARAHRLSLAQAGVAARVGGISLTHGGAVIAPRLGHGSRVGARGAARPAAVPAGRPVRQLFTARSRTYLQRNGMRVTRVFSEPVNFKGSDGRWQAIDDTLVATPGGFANRADTYALAVPRSLAAPVLVRVGRRWVSFRLVGGRAPATVRGTSASFTNALPGVSVTYVAAHGLVKENVTLTGQAAPARLAFDVALSAGLRLRARGARPAAVDRAGQFAFGLSSPFAYVPGRAGVPAHAVRVALRRTASGWRMVWHVDGRWLRGALRHGPVIVDPEVSTGPSQDCTVESSLPTTSACTSGYGEVGWNGSNDDHRYLLQFNVQGALPADSMVFNAKLGLYLYGESTTTQKSVSLYQVAHSWTTSATWNTYDGTNAWTAAGGDIAGGAQATNPTVGGATGWYYWYPTQLVQQWEDGTSSPANYGLMVRDTTPQQTTNVLQFYSNASTNPYLPYLDIAWQPRGLGDGSQYTLQHYQLGDSTDLGVNVASGDLFVKSRELHTAGTGLDFEVDRTWDSRLYEYDPYGSWTRWANSMAPYLINEPDGSRVVRFADRGFLPFLRNADGTFTTPAGIDADLCQVGVNNCTGSSHDADAFSGATAAYALTDRRSGTKWTFASWGAPLSETDRHNNAIVVLGGGAASGYKDTQGRTISEVNDSINGDTLLKSLTDWTNRTVSWVNDPTSGALMSFTDGAGKTWSYGYTNGAMGDLTQITDPLGHITKISYDSNQHVLQVTRVTNTTTMTGPTTHYGYYAGSDTTTGHACTTAGVTKKTVVTDDNGHQTTYCANALDQVIESYDALNNKTTNQYTPSGKTASYTDPTFQAQATTSSHSLDLKYSTNDNYDNLTDVTQQAGTATSPTTLHSSLTYTGTPPGFGNSVYDPWKTTDAQGQNFGAQYDTTRDVTRSGPIDSTTNPAFQAGYTQATYNTSGSVTSGTLASTTDGDGHTTSYAYSPASTAQLQSVTPPDTTRLGAKTYTEDALSRIRTVHDGNGNTWTYSYDGDDRVTNIAYQASGGATNNVGFSYDGAGNVLTRSDDVNGTSTYGYDALNRVTSESFPNGITNSYGYDGASNLTSFTNAAGTYSYAYQSNNQLKSITEPWAAPNQITWDVFDTTNNKQVMQYPNGVDVTWTYDVAHRPLQITAIKGASTLEDLRYSYTDAQNNHREQLQTATDALTGQTTSYSYGDPLERLTSAVTTNSAGTTIASHTYSYDGAGNMLTHNGTTYTYNADNQLTSDTGGTTYGYDLDGNQTSASNGFAAAYNQRNQTTSLTPAGGTAQALSYLGSSQNELIGDANRSLRYSRLGLSWFHSTSSGQDRYYTRTPDGTLVDLDVAGTHRYPLFDQLGSIVAQTDASGALARTYSYDPYGNRSVTGGTQLDDLFGYAGGYLTNAGLWHYGARYYNPGIARWTQQDQITSLSRDYTYGGDDAVNATDPSGMVYQEVAMPCAMVSTAYIAPCRPYTSAEKGDVSVPNATYKINEAETGAYRTPKSVADGLAQEMRTRLLDAFGPVPDVIGRL